MADIYIRPAVSADAAAMAPHMRKADLDGARAAAGMDALTALRTSLSVSALAWTGMVEDEPVCMFGVGSSSALNSRVGSPWLLGTDEIERHAVAFLRRSRIYVCTMQRTFPRLENYVHARHRVSLRWLRWLGFEVGPAEPYGLHRRRFHPFWMGH